MGIKRSFKKVRERDPDGRVLAVTCVLTPPERAIVKDLGSGTERPAIRVLDRPGWMTNWPSMRTWRARSLGTTRGRRHPTTGRSWRAAPTGWCFGSADRLP